MKLPVVLKALAAIWRYLNCVMQARTVTISPFLLRMLLPGILSDHDNQASISDLGRHFVRHFALKRCFWNEMDFSRPVASATNRRSLPRIDYAKWPIVRKIRRGGKNPTEWRFIWCKRDKRAIFVTTFIDNLIKIAGNFNYSDLVDYIDYKIRSKSDINLVM